MIRRPARLILPALLAAGLIGASIASSPAPRPDVEPAIVKPGALPDPSKPVPPPSDAIVLFDGSSLDAWQAGEGKPAKWALGDGAMTVNSSGGITTKEKFGDVQLHVEFATPSEVKGTSQERGNSGVYLQGRYEVQVLDSYENKTYPDGQCASIYKKHAPLVNASRAPGQWQSYDIIFRMAKYDESGKKISNARLTVFHNGVLVQDHAEVDGVTGSAAVKEDTAPGPIHLQDHGNPVKYRNIWVRKL